MRCAHCSSALSVRSACAWCVCEACSMCGCAYPVPLIVAILHRKLLVQRLVSCGLGLLHQLAAFVTREYVVDEKYIGVRDTLYISSLHCIVPVHQRHWHCNSGAKLVALIDGAHAIGEHALQRQSLVVLHMLLLAH